MTEKVEEIPAYKETTREITITVRPAYVEDGFQPGVQGFVFSYAVTVENIGSGTVQLLNRHWMIFSGGELFNEVRGDGVVGVQPVIKPGASYEYSSWAVINEPAGTMRGSYGFRAEDGELFRVAIPEFHLLAPHLIH